MEKDLGVFISPGQNKEPGLLGALNLDVVLEIFATPTRSAIHFPVKQIKS